MQKRLLLFYIVCLSFTMIMGFSLAAIAGDKETERACMTNFREEGNFFTGKIYKTWQDFPDANKAEVFENCAQTIAIDGWKNINTNKDIGIITASAEVIMGKNLIIPLNVVIKQKGGGIVRVEASFSTKAIQSTFIGTVRTELCKIVESAIE